MDKKTNINIIRAIVLASVIMISSLYFFIPYITENSVMESITRNAQSTVKQIKLTRSYYVDSIVQDIKKYAPTLSFSYDHEGINGRLPLPTTLIHDLSTIFSKNSGTTYKLYSEYPFKNRADRKLSPFEKEAIKYTKKNPNGLYVKRDIIDGEDVLRVATTDFMTSKACVNCHNNHPDKTWKEGFWKLGDKRGIIEVITPIQPALEHNLKIRNLILLLLAVISFSVLFLLSRFLLNNEKSLRKEISSRSSELEEISSLINENLISSKTDKKGIILSVSKAFIEISGYTKEELIGKSHNIVRHPEMNSDIFEDLWSTIKEKKPWSGDIRNRAKDGSSYYVHLTIFPNTDKHGVVKGYTSFRKDITQKILIEKKLELERIFKQVIFDNQDEILIISSFDHGITNINQKFFNIFDYKDLKDFKKQHRCICELFIPKKGYLKLKEDGRYWSDSLFEKPKGMHKALMRDKYGKERIFRVRIKEIVVAKKKYHITTFSNITELEKARELAESSEQAKASFMANMSHELRTPLNGINGFTELLSKTELNSKQRQYISLISTSSDNLIGIVNDILDFSKIESGNMKLSCIKINPFIEFKNILELFKNKTNEKSIQYLTKIDENIPQFIMIDKLRISQVLSNLIGNAIKFTPQKGVIKVSIQLNKIDREYIQLRFSVKDTGIGIPKDRQKSIFEAFTQADDSTTREYGGTGLGLSISVSLVQLMGGKLHLESEEGKGSTFSFTVRLKAVKEENMPRIDSIPEIKEEMIEGEVKKKTLTKSNILVVEDNEMNQILMDELLKQKNLHAHFVINGRDAIEVVKKAKYDLIFMDINMPELNGIDTTKEIRKSGNNVPIVALTANALEGDEQRFLKLGMDAYLSKPINYEDFDRIIQKYLT